MKQEIIDVRQKDEKAKRNNQFVDFFLHKRSIPAFE
jgi:hypothetical protein